MRVANNPLLAPRHWRVILEAGAALAAASAATRLLPFKRFIRLGALPVRRSRPLDARELARIMEGEPHGPIRQQKAVFWCQPAASGKD